MLPKSGPASIIRRLLVASVASVAVPRLLAQTARLPRIGIVFTRPRTSKDLQAFLEELRRLGYEEGRTVTIEYREGPPAQARDLAAEVVRKGVDVIFAPNTATAVGALRATRTIPIVFATAHDPVQAGLVSSLSKPGGTVTGITVFASELPAKRLQLFYDLMQSRLSRLAVLRSPVNEQTRTAWEALAAAAQKLEIALMPFDVAAPGDLPGAFGGMKRASVPAVLVHDDAFTGTQWRQIASLAIETRLASNSTWDEAVDAGVLFSYGPSLVSNFTRAAQLVDAILRGAKAADTPVEQPTRFKLALNTRTAAAISLVVPERFRAYVDEVVGG
jgi:putative ABC transport system substrate-binding protein